VFDPDPLALPAGLRGDIYRAADGKLIVTLVRNQVLKFAQDDRAAVRIRTADISAVCGVKLYQVGQKEPESIEWKVKDNELIIETLPKNMVAGLLKLLK